MGRKISSRWTGFTKLGWPILYGLVMGGQVYYMSTRISMNEDSGALIAFLAVGVATGVVVFWWLGKRWKHVEIVENGINVTGYLTSDFIPFSRFADVKQCKWWTNSQCIFIILNEETTFGRKIVFMPRGMCSAFSEHPIVGELRHVAGLGDPKSTQKTPPPLPPPIPKQ